MSTQELLNAIEFLIGVNLGQVVVDQNGFAENQARACSAIAVVLSTDNFMG
jgi:hypothetical protein